jgi:hypothetical protein
MPINGLNGRYGFSFNYKVDGYSESLSIKHSFDADNDDMQIDFILYMLERALAIARCYGPDAAEILHFDKTNIDMRCGSHRTTYRIENIEDLRQFHREAAPHFKSRFLDPGLLDKQALQSQLKCTPDKIVAIHGGLHIKESFNTRGYSESYEQSIKFNEAVGSLNPIDQLALKWLLYQAYVIAASNTWHPMTCEETKIQVDFENAITSANRRTVIFDVKDKASFADFVQTCLGFLPRPIHGKANTVPLDQQPLASPEMSREESLLKGPEIVTKYRLVQGAVKREQTESQALTCWQSLRDCLGM